MKSSRPPPSLRGYRAALSRHLKGDKHLHDGAARSLGMRAVKLGLETLDLAKIHKDSLLALGAPLYSASTSDEMIPRAGTFFSEAFPPIEETHRGVREANVRLKTAFEELSLRTAELTAGTPLKVTFTASPAVEDLDNGIRTVLYRIAQEALSNVARHSKATQARVTIGERGGMVRMEVIDNGVVFLVDGLDMKRGTERLGLLGMRERVEMVGGTFCVESFPGKKTVIEVEIPYGKKRTKMAKKMASPSTPLKCP